MQDDSSDLTIANYTAVKKRKLDFELRTLQLQYTDITTIMNKLALNQVIHIHPFLQMSAQKGRNGRIENFLKCWKQNFLIKLQICKILTQKFNVQIVNMNSFPMKRMLYVAFAKHCPLLPNVIPQY